MFQVGDFNGDMFGSVLGAAAALLTALVAPLVNFKNPLSIPPRVRSDLMRQNVILKTSLRPCYGAVSILSQKLMPIFSRRL
jgi:hypothetical protein